MILSLPLTIFLYQLIAACGVLATSALVIYFADTDFQLMFLQGPVDKMRNWKRFKSKTLSKLMVLLFTVLVIAIVFLPTLLVFAMECIGDRAYYFSSIEMYSQEEFANDPFSNPNPLVLPTPFVKEYPPFDDFRAITWDEMFSRPEYQFRSWITTESIVQNYLHKQLGLPFYPNTDGVWYGVLKNLTLFQEEGVSNNHYYDYSEYQREHEAPIVQEVDAATGTYRTDDRTPTYTFGMAGQNSFSLHACDGQLTSNLPDFESHQLLAVSNVTEGVVCYPQFDTTLPITVQVGSVMKNSVLEENDRVFRTANINDLYDSFSTISVSAMSLNDTFLTMAIKKAAHITYHGDTIYYSDSELLNCSSANLDNIFEYETNYEYNRLNHTKILCQLKSLSQQNPSFNMLQATHRSFDANFSMNSVYTYSAPTVSNPLGGIAIDLTWFTSYTLKSPVFNFPKDQEYLIAHVFNDEQSSYLSRNIEELIAHTDVFGVSDQQDPVLPNLVKIQASLKARNSYYFSKTTGSVRLAYDILGESKWTYMVAILGCVFFLLACLAASQRKRSLRAWISACPVVERLDDAATFVAGRDATSRPSFSTIGKPTKLSFCHQSATQTSIPVLTMDGKSILLQQ